MTKLYVGNLAWHTTDEGLASEFSKLGTLTSVEIAVDRMTGRSRGFGFLVFENSESAESAVAAMDGRDLDGRNLHVNVAAVPSDSGRPRRRSFAPSEFESPPPFDDKSDDLFYLAEELPANKAIIEVSNQYLTELIKYYHSNPSEIHFIDHRKFEELVAEIWDGLGYKVELTKATKDGGYDIIAVNSIMINQQYLIECKRPKLGKVIAVSAVRELYGITESKGATKGILATTARFSREATMFLTKHEWRLEGKDYEGVMEWINMYLKNKG